MFPFVAAEWTLRTNITEMFVRERVKKRPTFNSCVVVCFGFGYCSREVLRNNAVADAFGIPSRQFGKPYVTIEVSMRSVRMIASAISCAPPYRQPSHG